MRMGKPQPSPKGLFDPYYVPEKLLHRDRELSSIEGNYRDSCDGDYGINCLVHGITGVGMTVFSRYFLTRIVPQQMNAMTLYVDAKQKDSLEIVSELNGAQGEAMDIGGYYRPDQQKTEQAMRPSPTLNAIIDAD